MANQTILSYEVIDLSDIAPTGEAIGNLDGMTVHVPFGLPGERVRVEIVEQTRTIARARLVEVVTPSPDRVVAPCDYFGSCGGCDWQHMRYTTQLEHKRTLVYRQLTEVALLANPEVRPCLPSFYSYDYRNSAVFQVLPNGRPAYPARNPKEKIVVDECPILEPPLEDELHKAALLGVGARREWAIRMPEPITVGNFDYYVGPNSLFPVNTLAAEQLVAEVVAALEPSQEQNHLDLYCGIGLFTLPLAVMSAEVIGVEPNADEGRDARRNVMSIRNRLFYKPSPRILSYEISPGLARPEVKEKRWHGAVIRPANAPLDSITIGQLAKLGLARLVYVASGMETLGRDLKVLASKGFRFEYAQPLDMMPQTRHVQAVVRLNLD